MCLWGGLISIEQNEYLYTSLHVEMHEFIFNRDAYDVIKKVVVGNHFLMKFLNLYSWPKNCGVCVEGHFKFLHTHIHLSVVKYNCVIKLSCLAKSLILDQLLIILYASTTQLCGLCTSFRDLCQYNI